MQGPSVLQAGLRSRSRRILAYHAQTYTPLMAWPFVIEGTKFMPVIWLVAMVVSAVVAFVIGLLSLRTSGVYFIMITLAFGQMFYFFTISWPRYGGEDGLSIYVRNGFPGLNTLDPIQFFAICLALLCAVLWLNARIVKSPFGLALGAARQVPQRVETVGLDPFRLKLVALVISGTICGLAGALFADLNRFVSPTMCSWQMSGELIVFIILGGLGRVFGPVAGATLFVLLEHLLGGVSDYFLFYVGLLLLLVVLFTPGGIYGILLGRSKS